MIGLGVSTYQSVKESSLTKLVLIKYFSMFVIDTIKDSMHALICYPKKGSMYISELFD